MEVEGPVGKSVGGKGPSRRRHNNGNNVFDIFIKTLSGRTVSLEVSGSTTLAVLKQQLHDKTSIASQQMRLLFQSKQLVGDHLPLSNFAIGQEAMLFLVTHLRTAGDPSSPAPVPVPADSEENCDDSSGSKSSGKKSARPARRSRARPLPVVNGGYFGDFGNSSPSIMFLITNAQVFWLVLPPAVRSILLALAAWLLQLLQTSWRHLLRGLILPTFGIISPPFQQLRQHIPHLCSRLMNHISAWILQPIALAVNRFCSALTRCRLAISRLLQPCFNIFRSHLSPFISRISTTLSTTLSTTISRLWNDLGPLFTSLARHIYDWLCIASDDLRVGMARCPQFPTDALLAAVSRLRLQLGGLWTRCLSVLVNSALAHWWRRFEVGVNVWCQRLLAALRRARDSQFAGGIQQLLSMLLLSPVRRCCAAIQAWWRWRCGPQFVASPGSNFSATNVSVSITPAVRTTGPLVECGQVDALFALQDGTEYSIVARNELPYDLYLEYLTDGEVTSRARLPRNSVVKIDRFTNAPNRMRFVSSPDHQDSAIHSLITLRLLFPGRQQHLQRRGRGRGRGAQPLSDASAASSSSSSSSSFPAADADGSEKTDVVQQELALNPIVGSTQFGSQVVSNLNLLHLSLDMMLSHWNEMKIGLIRLR